MRSRVDPRILDCEALSVGRFVFKMMHHEFLPEQQRHDEEDSDDGCDHASYDNASERLLSLGSDAIGERGRKEAETGGHAGHDDGAHLVDAAVLQASSVDTLALSAAHP